MDYKNGHLLWSVEQLRDQSNHPDLIILDLRPPEDFANGHIPGARSLDIFGISLVDTRPQPLAAFLWIIEHLIDAKGVSTDSRVVVYDRISGERAARLFWFLEFFGHAHVHLLNGGYQAWTGNGFDTTRDAKVWGRGNFKANARPELLATGEDVLERLGKQETAIVDARSAAEHNATLVRSARGGRIPGAVHMEWTHNLDSDGMFKPAGDLAARYAGIGVTPDREVIPYCQGGYRSANTYLALRLIAYPRVRNYLGSWGEWGNRSEFPIEGGD